MEPNALTDVLFWIVSIGAILGALSVVGIKNTFRSAIALVATMFLLAINFFLLGADFVGIVQILVNVGAVAIILIFGISLIGNMRAGVGEARKLTVSLSLVALILSGFAFAILIFGLSSTISPTAPTGQVANLIGDLILTQYLGVFQVVGILIAVAIIGALVVMRSAIKLGSKEDGGEGTGK